MPTLQIFFPKIKESKLHILNNFCKLVLDIFLFPFPPHTLFKMMFLQLLLRTKILDYKPESFSFKCISRVTVSNSNTNFVHTIFPILQKVCVGDNIKDAFKIQFFCNFTMSGEFISFRPGNLKRRHFSVQTRLKFEPSTKLL